MNKLFQAITIIFAVLAGSTAHATLSSGSTGADGAFSPTVNTQLQVPPSGIFNFTTINIPSNVTVTFKSNAANTPVYMLAQGTDTTTSVTIAGTINLNGGNSNGVTPGVAGPGGFGGGRGTTGQYGTQGMGPGGGLPVQNSSVSCYGGGGGFLSQGSWAGNSGATLCPAGGPAYGNSNLQPLIGGSGGGAGGYPGVTACSGGGGGGAILIAANGAISFTGTITATGGGGGNAGGSGSGGAVRLVSYANPTYPAYAFTGNGTVNITGGTINGSSGRLRIEANSVDPARTVGPIYTYPLPSAAFVSNIPTFTITSIGVGQLVPPASPTASFSSPDVRLPSGTANPVPVNLSATNIDPTSATITVTVIPQVGSATSVTGTLSGTTSSSTATINVTLPLASTGYASLILATVTFTPPLAMYYNEEQIDKIRIAAAPGRASMTTYITVSGKEYTGPLVNALSGS